MQQEDGRHVRFDNNDHDNGENDNELPRPQTALGSRDRRSDEEDNAVESARRRSSSDPSGRGRQRPRLAVLRPRGNAAGGPALAQISEDSRSGSTAFFNAPGGRNAVRPELADILDVIGMWWPLLCVPLPALVPDMLDHAYFISLTRR